MQPSGPDPYIRINIGGYRLSRVIINQVQVGDGGEHTATDINVFSVRENQM